MANFDIQGSLNYGGVTGIMSGLDPRSFHLMFDENTQQFLVIFDKQYSPASGHPPKVTPTWSNPPLGPYNNTNLEGYLNAAHHPDQLKVVHHPAGYLVFAPSTFYS